MRLNSFLAAVLIPGAASAFTAYDALCSIQLGTPAADLRHFASPREAFQQVLERFDPESVPKDDALAVKALCGDEGCPGQVVTDYRNGTEIHAIIFNDDGSDFSIVEDLGWIGGASACALGEPTGRRIAEDLYLFRVDEKWGEFQNTEDGYCGDVSFATSYLLLDTKQKRWLVAATNVGDATLEVTGDTVSISACGGLTLETTVDALRAGKAELKGASKDVSALVNAGRRATKAKQWDTAIGHFTKATEADPSVATGWSGLGYALLGKGDLGAARAAFERALGATKDPKLQAMVWFNLGLVAEREKKPDVARAAFEKSQALNPSTAAEKKLRARRQ